MTNIQPSPLDYYEALYLNISLILQHFLGERQFQDHASVRTESRSSVTKFLGEVLPYFGLGCQML